MEYIQLKGTSLTASRAAFGCMRLAELSVEQAKRQIEHAMELGINFFDHADIYGGGSCEEIFAKAVDMKPSVREKMILQSKCSIRDGYYDASAAYIRKAVDDILARLHTDYLDILLLHRPDALMDPGETAEALERLHEQGKVRYFGVSNYNVMQTELLQKYMKQPLVGNQLQISLAHTPLIDEGMAVNMDIDQSVLRTGGLLPYCQWKEINVQAWSPYQKGFFGGSFIGDLEEYGELNSLIDSLASKYGVSKTGIAAAWLFRHPVNMQVILGTMNEKHRQEGCEGLDVVLERKEWYDLYRAAGNIIP